MLRIYLTNILPGVYFMKKTFLGNCEKLCLSICNSYTKQEIKNEETLEVEEVIYSCHYWACKEKDKARKK
jgi:hypothetical protein